MKTLTKKCRLVWSDRIILYSKDSSGKTLTSHNSFECDTQTKLDAKVIELGFEIPQDEEI